MFLWRVCLIMTGARPYVNMLAAKAKRDREVVLTPTAMSWRGKGLRSGRGTHGNQRGLARLHCSLGLLMAFQVWGCHLSAWLMSVPWGSFSFHHPSLHHQRKSTGVLASAAGEDVLPESNEEEKKKHLSFKLAGRAGSVQSTVRVREYIYCRI